MYRILGGLRPHSYRRVRTALGKELVIRNDDWARKYKRKKWFEDRIVEPICKLLMIVDIFMKTPLSLYGEDTIRYKISWFLSYTILFNVSDKLGLGDDA